MAAKLPLEASPQDLFAAAGWRSPAVLLESARFHPVTGRYSLMVGEPALFFTAKGDRIALVGKKGIERLIGSPLDLLRQLLDAKPVARVPGFPPFVGGAIGFFGFDAYRYVEPLASKAQDDLGLPDIGFLFCDESVLLDHLKKQLWVIVVADAGRNPAKAYDQAVGRAEALLKRITCSVQNELPSSPAPRPVSFSSTHTRADFEAMVRCAKEFIADGEIYQANLSQRFSMPLTQSPWEFYRRLAEINPSPFACYADFGFLQVISASPERFLRVSAGEVETRPIAGTRPKGKTAVETARLRQELILNEKERAEHLMLVDLERNDLGRVCRAGSVRVDELMVLEEFSHVIHIVSNVKGVLRPGVRPVDLVAAAFPGGTITGCPKIACLKVIDSLEPVRRQLYTGSLGYISYTGDSDLNLLIRTGLAVNETVYVQAGAGIVADSDPSREYDETVHKAQALMDAFRSTSSPVRELVEHASGS